MKPRTLNRQESVRIISDLTASIMQRENIPIDDAIARATEIVVKVEDAIAAPTPAPKKEGPQLLTEGTPEEKADDPRKKHNPEKIIKTDPGLPLT
jgi:hypothetical protein